MTKEIKTRIEQIQNSQVPDGYKKTKLSIVPCKWEEIRFDKVFSRITRKNTENNKNVLTISAQKGLINQNDFFNKEIASEDKSNYYLLKNGDFAYNKSYSKGYPLGAIKKLKYYKKGVVSPLYVCFSPSEKNNFPDFYEQYFEAGYFNKEIQSIAQEGARNHGLLNISIDDFFNSNVLYPPLPEQEKIAKILTIQDTIIELKEKRIAEKEKQKKYLMQNLLTGKKRLADFSGEWERKSIGEIADIVTGTTPSTKIAEYYNGEYPWITPSDIGDSKNIEISERTLTKKGIAKGRLLPKNSVLVTCIASIGKNAILKIDGSCNQQINAVLPNKATNCDYIYYLITFNNQKLNKFAGKSATPIINKETFSNMLFVFPPLPEQNAIAEILSTADKEIELLKKDLDAEKEKKKSLMQLLLTGIVRVES